MGNELSQITEPLLNCNEYHQEINCLNSEGIQKQIIQNVNTCAFLSKSFMFMKLKHSIKITKTRNENATETSYEEEKFLHTTCWRNAYNWRNTDHATSKKYCNVYA